MSEPGSASDPDYAQRSPTLPASPPLPLPDFPLYGTSPIPQDLPFTSPGRMARPHNTGFIDLTADTSPSTSSTFPPMLRPPSLHRDEPASKRRRVNNGTHVTPYNLQRPLFQPIPETMDLTKVDDDAGLHRIQQEQRLRHDRQLQRQQEQQKAESIRALHEQSRKPLRISDLQCVVCMENMTNITATHCGHLFCHTCIMEALIAGENQGMEPGKGPSRCPVCRKRVIRTRSGKDLNQVIPLELKLMTKSAIAKGKEKARVTSSTS